MAARADVPRAPVRSGLGEIRGLTFLSLAASGHIWPALLGCSRCIHARSRCQLRSAQRGAYPCPCGLELGLAVIKVDAAAVGADSGLAVHEPAPRPLRKMGWHAAALHDPANGQAAPDHGEVVVVSLACEAPRWLLRPICALLMLLAVRHKKLSGRWLESEGENEGVEIWAAQSRQL